MISFTLDNFWPKFHHEQHIHTLPTGERCQSVNTSQCDTVTVLQETVLDPQENSSGTARDTGVHTAVLRGRPEADKPSGSPRVSPSMTHALAAARGQWAPAMGSVGSCHGEPPAGCFLLTGTVRQ